MYSHVVLAATFATLAYGYTQPTNQTWGALNSPSLNDPVTQGQTAKVIWDPTGHDTDGVTVSLVLCHGDTTNCVDAPDAIASGLPADQKEYDWDVPCTLAPGTQLTDSGYGMLIIVDQTGEFQCRCRDSFAIAHTLTCFRLDPILCVGGPVLCRQQRYYYLST